MAKSFQDFLDKKDVQLQEAFNSAPYELSFGKKNAGDIYFTFVDEDEKEFRIQFYTPQGLGKNVRQVFIGQKRGSTYPDAIARFKNPMRVIASMIEATRQFLATPLGKTIDGFAINFSKKALDRGVVLLPKIIRQSGLKQKLSVMDLTYSPVPDRAFVWVIRKGSDPAQVFDGPKMQGITWDDPDKVGDVPPEQPEQNAVSTPSIKNGIAQHMTSRDMNNHPFRQKVLSIVDIAVQEEGIATPGNSKGYYKFANGGTFRLYFNKVQNDTFFGSLATNSGVVDITSPFNADYAADDFLSAIRKAYAANQTTQVTPVDNTPVLDNNRWRQICQTLINTVRGSKNVFTSTNFVAVYAVGTAGAQVKVTLERGRTYASGRVEAFDNNQKVIPGPIGSWPINHVDTPSDVKGAIARSIVITIDELKKYIETQTSVPGVNNPELTTDRWRALVNAFFKVNELRGVSSPKRAGGTVTFGGKGYVDVNMERGGNGEPVVITAKAMTEYGPNGKVIGDPVVIQNIDITRPSKLTPLVQAAVDKLAPIVIKTDTKNAGVSLADYSESIRAAAPKTRDIVWQVNMSRDGSILNIGWDLAWRRNTSEGAYLEFKGQIDRANQYLKSVYDDAKSKGYKPSEPDYVTIETARASDDIAERNEGSAYSEYEQSMGGNLQINAR